ncbi:MAG: hypothetical protein MZW92_12565 [Comamonadaceae bacterium]|nr:hypothetical protein [Comamonadaceae bacterium]
MRNRDVFGKKINHVSFVIVLALLFLAILGVRLGMLAVLNAQLSDLQAEQIVLQRRIDAIVAAAEDRSYHEVADIVDELPLDFDQIDISDDLSFARGIAGIVTTDYLEAILDGAENPFEDDLPDTVTAVRIAISMTVADASLLPAYLQALTDLGRIFHIETVAVDYLDAGAFVSLTVYTFYNDLD